MAARSYRRLGPGRFNQQPAGRVVAGLGDTAVSDARTAGLLARHQPEIGHELARIGEARRVSPSSTISVAALTSPMPRVACTLPRQVPAPVRQHRFDLRRQPIAPGLASFDCVNVILKHDMMHRRAKWRPTSHRRRSLVQVGRP
jgi:hypothetical protein